MEAGPWRGRPRWAAPPEARDVVTGAPARSALLGTTNTLGPATLNPQPTSAGPALICPSGTEHEAPRSCSDVPSDVTCPDDSVLMGSPQRAPPAVSGPAASRLQPRQAAKIAAAEGAAAVSTASADVLLGSVVVSRPQQDARTGTLLRT